MHRSLGEWFFGARLGWVCGGGGGKDTTNAPGNVVENHSTGDLNGNVAIVAEEKTVLDSFDEEELQDILIEVARENGFKMPKYQVTVATKAGDNYLGRVFRAVIYESGHYRKERLSLIFKVAPASKVWRDTFSSGDIFTNEANMYQIVLPAMNSFLKEYGLSEGDWFPNTAKCLASKLNSNDLNRNAEDVLVLEDMAPQGYVMLDRTVGLELDMCRMVLEILAFLHATSLAMRHLRPDDAAEIESTIKETFFVPDSPVISDLMTTVSNNLTYVEARYPKGTPEYDKLKDLTDNFADVMSNAVQPNDKLSCLMHGDCWTNNILFQKNKSGTVEKACLIDLQICRIGSPVLDVIHFFFTSTTKELRDVHFQSLLQVYYNKLTSTLLLLGCDPEEIVPWSLFQQQLQEYGHYGMGWSMFTVPLFLTESSDIADINSVMENGETNVTNLVNAENHNRSKIEERLSDILQDCIEYGYM